MQANKTTIKPAPANNKPHIHHSITNFPALPDDAVVDVKTVAALIGLSTNSVWRMARSGDLPAPIKVGPKSTRWKVGALRAYLASLV